ncbi:MAG: hypothetical protein NVSMB47_19280 [Polyangiales bacterium]
MIYVVRHAPVDAAGLCYGRHDVPVLLDHAAASARVLSQLEGVTIARVSASPSERASGLGAYLAMKLGLPLTLDPRLFEMSFGEWEGRTYAALERDDGERFRAWMEDWRHAAPPGGERLDALRDRVEAWWLEACALEGDTLAVTHAGVVRALRARAQRLDFGDALAARVEHLVVESVDPSRPIDQ